MRYIRSISMVATTLCVLSSVADVQGAAHNLSGLYAGVGIGRSVAGDAGYKALVNSTQVLSSSDGFSGMLVSGIFGGQKDMGNLVLGGELTVSGGNAKTTKRENGRYFKTTQKVSGDLVARVGYKLAQETPISQELMGYVSGGVAYTAFVKNIPAETSGITTRHTRRLWGGVVGAGVEMRVQESYLAGLEIKRTMYKEEKLNQQGTATVNDIFKPATMAVMARVTYKIN